MRWLVPVVYLVLAAATATAAVLAAPGEGPGATVVAADGGFELSNSRDGAAIFTAGGIGPGDSASGTVEVAASGEETPELTLTRHDLLDTPGPGGGLLSGQLTLRVRELGAGAATVYSGPLATMPPQELGPLELGSPRSFEFVATLPEVGSAVGQNAVQGAATSVAYAWTASEAGEQPPAEVAPGGSEGGGDPPEPPVAADGLDLVVTKVRHRIRRGRLLIWARCDRPCAIVARGRLRAHDEDDRRATRLRLARRAHFIGGTRKLRIVLPRGFRTWLAADPSREWARGRVNLLAWDATGDRDRVRRTLRLRSAR